MKNIRTSFFATLLLLVSFVSSGTAGHDKRSDSTSNPICLEVLGMALDVADKPIDGAQIRLYKENDELEWTEITNVFYHEHSFVFKLEPNEYYTIEISKPGYVTRSVAISTVIPKHISLKQIFRYEFEVQLFSVKTNTNDFYLDFPVALISYDAERDVFDNNYAYTRHIKSMIRETTNETNSTFNTKK